VIRAAIARWESGADHVSGPLPDGQLGAIVEVMLGTSARIGEVLAIRRRDVDITSAVPSIRLAGTIVSRNGEPTFRQDHPKTAKSRRIVALPTFASDAVRRRLANAGRLELDALLFQSRDGTPLTTGNVRRQLRRVLGGAGIAGVTPHTFRRTVATAVKRQRRRRARGRAARPHGHEGHGDALHPAQGVGEPGDSGATRPGVQAGRGLNAVMPRWQDRTCHLPGPPSSRGRGCLTQFRSTPRSEHTQSASEAAVGGETPMERVHHVLEPRLDPPHRRTSVIGTALAIQKRS